MRLSVKSAKPYLIITENGALEKLGELVKESSFAAKVAVITDSNVEKLYLGKVLASLEAAGLKHCSYVIPAGEGSKTPETYLALINFLSAERLNRDDAVIALGGGVIGDIAGFAAATYLRGIDLIQVPTTLLAAIDSSIGGKTGVDLPAGKNLLGAFYQPVLVLFDPETLATLPEREFECGIGEGIKYAVLSGGRVFALLKASTKENLPEFISLCQKYKAEIVAEDEKESCKRMLLNLGHTLGHAIEKFSGYTIPHGRAVAIGLRYIAESAYAAGELHQTDYAEIISLLNKYGFTAYKSYPRGALAALAAYDKKSRSDGIFVVKIGGIGKCCIEKLTLENFIEYVKAGEDYAWENL